MDNMDVAPGGPANTYDSTYTVEDQEYSPQVAGYIDVAEAAYPEVTHRESPVSSSRDGIAAAIVPRPPDPATGGLPGISHGLGWSTGIRNSRAFRQNFDGRTLVMPSMGVHPQQGPVGYSTRTDRLAYGAAALQTDGMPTDANVTKIFADPTAGDFAAAQGVNPNYV